MPTGAGGEKRARPELVPAPRACATVPKWSGDFSRAAAVPVQFAHDDPGFALRVPGGIYRRKAKHFQGLVVETWTVSGWRCEHGRSRSACVDCGGGSICEHGSLNRKCMVCLGGDLCANTVKKARLLVEAQKLTAPGTAGLTTNAGTAVSTVCTRSDAESLCDAIYDNKTCVEAIRLTAARNGNSILLDCPRSGEVGMDSEQKREKRKLWRETLRALPHVRSYENELERKTGVRRDTVPRVRTGSVSVRCKHVFQGCRFFQLFQSPSVRCGGAGTGLNQNVNEDGSLKSWFLTAHVHHDCMHKSAQEDVAARCLQGHVRPPSPRISSTLNSDIDVGCFTDNLHFRPIAHRRLAGAG